VEGLLTLLKKSSFNPYRNRLDGVGEPSSILFRPVIKLTSQGDFSSPPLERESQVRTLAFSHLRGEKVLRYIYLFENVAMVKL